MFNPFPKTIGEQLTEADLLQLIASKVSEGLYIEYKSDFPNGNMKIANSIASFANSHGGWYIVGIEASKPDNLPVNLLGVDLAKYPDPISKVRDVLKTHIDPLPGVFQQLVALASNRSVLVTHIPSEQDKPFVTKDGRIYRRAADSSDPVYERDRYTIDRLYAEGRRFRKKFLDMRKKPSQQFQGMPWLDLSIVPYPPNVVDKSVSMEVEKVAELLARTKLSFPIPFSLAPPFESSVPLNMGFANGSSLIFRQVSPQSGHYRGTSVNFQVRGGAARFETPLCFVSATDGAQLKSPEAQQVLDDLVSPLHLLDIGTTLLTLANLITFYLDWLGPQPMISEFRFAATLTGMKGVLPFFDDAEWASHVKTFGLPISHHKQILVPDDGWYAWDVNDDYPLWQLIATFLSFSVGVSESIFGHALGASFKRISESGGKVTSHWVSR